MALPFERVAIVGATGPTGRTLCAELAGRGFPLRVIGRRPEVLANLFADDVIEKRAGDAMDAAAIAGAVEGCDLVVDCIGLPPDRMADHVATARNIAAADAAGARILQVSSYWCYMPLTGVPVSETHPRSGGPPWARIRRQTEDILRQAGAAIVHLPDFFGPGVHTSTLQGAIREAVAGKPMNWIGGGVKRDFVFVPDAMAVAADLCVHHAAYGEDWVVPGSGPVSGDDIAGMLSEILGHPVRVRAASPLLLRIVSVFNARLRAFLPMVPDYQQPLAFNGDKLAALLGPPRRTPWRDALAATVAAIRAE